MISSYAVIEVKPGFDIDFWGSSRVFMGRWGSLGLLSIYQSFTIAKGLSGLLRVFSFVLTEAVPFLRPSATQPLRVVGGYRQEKWHMWKRLGHVHLCQKMSLYQEQSRKWCIFQIKLKGSVHFLTDDYAKDGGVWLLCSFHHEPLHTWIVIRI